MRRRELVLLLGAGIIGLPCSARSQRPSRRIGALMVFAADDAEAQIRVRVLEQGLRDLGWEQGRNVAIEYRWAAGDLNRLRMFAQELVGLRPDIIVAQGTPSVIAIRQQTDTLPIVFVGVTDPIASALTKSLSHPSGNFTGLTNFEPSMTGKSLELLKEAAPKIIRIALMFNPETAPGTSAGQPFLLSPFEAIAPSFAVETIPTPVHDDVGIESVMAALGRDPGSGLVLLPDTFMVARRKQVVGLANRYHVPAIYPFRYFATDGGLMSYGPNNLDTWRRVAGYVDRLLRGAVPADLPIEQPLKYELVVNVKTAIALGLVIPPMLLARADEVIE
jgi:putative tryptophan/tyrosine transport system substrate-binding protein